MFLQAETSFGLRLLQQYPINESFVFSPLSIALALSLVHSGSNGTTKSQISDAICKGANDDQLKQHYGYFISSFAKFQRGVKVDVANKVFLNQMFPIKTSYLNAIKNDYNATAENLDFSDADKAAEVMNQFVNEQTRGKIPSIIERSQVKPSSVAFLINALYFNGDWSNPFSKSKTGNQTFYASENSQREIPFMNNWRATEEYFSNDELEVVSRKYLGSQYKFNIFLPKEKFGLTKFVKSLNADKFQTLLTSVNSSTIDLTIPKMKIQSKKQLRKMLEMIGITRMFEEKSAEFGLMSERPIFVDEATHKAIIEVDERGTTAAAVTAIGTRRPTSSRVKPPPIPHFKADHPYLYSITFNNHILFMGIFI